MATANKFNDFVNQLGLGKHVFGTHQYNIMLTNTAPVATNSVKADLTEIAAGNGYSSDGSTASATWAAASGTGTLTGTAVVFTASGGAIATFRYAVLMNVTQTTPLKPLVIWWDNVTQVTLNSGDTFTVKFNNSATTGTILTIT